MFGQINHFLFLLFSFFFPLSVALGNLLIIIISVLWLFSGKLKEKFHLIKANKFAMACIYFFVLHIISLLWTEDFYKGLERTKKMLEFGIYIPILLSIIKIKNIEKYLTMFLISIGIMVLTSYLIFFELIAPTKGSTINDPTPFMSHITYTPMIAIGFYLSSRFLLSMDSISMKNNKAMTIFLVFISISSFINVFMTEGRAGYVILFILLSLLFFQAFGTNLKAIFLSIVSIAIVFFAAYLSSPTFKQKIQSTFDVTNNFSNIQNSSIGKRLIMADISIEIFKENFLFGTGVGDFEDDYKKIMLKKKLNNEIYTDIASSTKNPHNFYLLVAAELGFVGLLFLGYLFFAHFKLALTHKSMFKKDILISIGICFLALNFSDSYFLGHFSSFLYLFFVSLLLSERA